jgi:ketol-acid reductoisomerase
MTTILHQADADRSVLDGAAVAVIGYGNQGRSWALNLRDSGLAPQVCVRADATRDRAIADGFDAVDLEEASAADVVCVLIPDDVIPTVPVTPRGDALVVVASV